MFEACALFCLAGLWTGWLTDKIAEAAERRRRPNWLGTVSAVSILAAVLGVAGMIYFAGRAYLDAR